jgi:amino acid adenylation domain-containing protein
VLDRGQRPAPVGVAGELYAGGDGLALGYLGDPVLTAERFVPNPFGDGRLYRTGDMVRWLADGSLEFLGRADRQVKIRGYRVEPGEVEAALVSRPGVRDAAVVSRPGRAGRPELVAYVVPDAAGAIEDGALVGRLREDLRRTLPEFMVPSAVVLLEALPLTPNGKLDRRALPDPVPAASGPDAPTTATEAALAAIFCEVLGLERVGARQSFFDLGGNSLVATQLVARVRGRLGRDLPLRRVFETPDVAGLARALDAVGPPAGRPTGTEAIPRVDRRAALTLSFAQERLWFLHRLEPENPFYNVAVALRIEGGLDADALERSLQAIVDRHEILRTTYHEVDGRPVQRIDPDFRLALERRDLRGAASADGEAERLAREEARRPFDLAAGPVVRATLLVLEPGRHVLLVTIHHIAADGWSMGVLVDELAAAYRAHAEGRPPALPTLGAQYADFALWQRRALEGDVYASQLAYWRRRLEAHPSELALPTDRPRPPVQTFRGGSVRFEVDAETTARLAALAREHDATLFMALLAVFGALLSRHAGQTDLIVGSPIANRTRTELEPLIGFFVNTMALRLDLSGEPSLREVLGRCRALALEAYANQDLPFERLVDELQPERDLSRNPLFQVMFAHQNAPLRPVELSDLRATPLEPERTAAQFDLVLDTWERDGGLLGVLEFSTDLFDRDRIVRMVDQFRTLLAGAVARPAAPLCALPLLPAEERRRVLVDFNANRAAFPVDRTLHALFEAEVDAGPDRVAAEHGDRQVSYGALDARANRIAHRLRRLGVERNEFVAILLERGIDFLAAMLGILKSGGAYVPVDPSYPEDRIAYMIAHSAARVLVSRRGLAAPFLAGPAPALRPVLLDEDDLSAERVTAPPPVNQATDRAYMLYTSGSTGLPKGAILRHDGKVNHIYGQFRWLEFHRDSAFLQSAPASSDISVWQFLGPVLIGGRTVIADYETLCEPAALWALIRARGVTIIELVPVAMAALLAHVATRPAAERASTRLEWAMVTGEAVPPGLVNRWIELFPRVPVVNAYGPTEAADDVCQYVLRAPLAPDARSVPVGTPLANLTMYVLDPHLGLAPIGVPGEICVSGIGVGEGYWREEVRTRQSFVPNPYRDGGRGDVLYRTGDIGYWRPDGVLECLSRIDEQVKIRGFRIEPGEVEAVIGRHPAVREAVVVAREDAPGGDRRLAAYVVPDLGIAEVAAEARRAREEQVELWRELHESEYRQSLDHGDPTFDVIGWDSSYDNRPLPLPEMREYVDHTVARILALRPRRLLEIGCGTGLLMFRLLPHLEAYVGMDLSAVAIERLRALQRDPALRARVPGLEGAVLRAGAADDLAGIEPGSIDTVILPSVVQYFPGLDYFLAVLDGVVRVLSPGGAIFVGDVRSLPLLELFHTSVQLVRAGDEVPADELIERIRGQGLAEQELALDPALFVALRRRHRAIRDVEVLPKRGRPNEMTRFRYDVTLRFGAEGSGRAAADWQPWAPRWTLAGLEAHLRGGRPPALALRDVPSARVQPELAVRTLLAARRHPPAVGELRRAASASAPPGLEPEDLWALGEALGYDTHISLARSGPDGRLDVAFVRRDRPDGRPPALLEPDTGTSGTRYANSPIHERLARALGPRLREYVKERLPLYMVPSAVVVLERFPTTPAGKVDRQALPAPWRGEGSPDELIAPRTEVERALAAIWCEVLGLERCGVRQSFFDLGGHSLKATQVVSRIRQRLGVELPLRAIFSHPTIEELAGPVAEAARAAPPAIARGPDAPHHPVSHAQRRLWVLAQIEAGSVAYNMPASVLLEGTLDRPALERALAAVVSRHEALRTTFATVDGEPRQRIHATPAVPLRFVDLAGQPDGEARAREEALRDAATPFDLEHGPLVRTALLRLAPDRHVLLFSMHHIVGDDWSIGVLTREVMRAYGGLPIRPLRLQYRDYARWQNAGLDSDEARAHRAYWLSRFAGEVPVLDLPTDHPRPPVKTYRGRTLSVTWGAEETRGLADLARRHRTTLFVVLLAAVKALLYRYTGQTDLVVAAPVAGRDHADLEDQIGVYVNALALRDALRPEAPFTEFLAVVAGNTTEALEHQAYPFDRLVDELALRRDPSRMPLCDVVVVMQNTGAPDLSLPGLAVRPFLEEYGASKYDLHFAFEERGGALRASLVYNPDLFEPDRIERMAAHLGMLLRGIVAEPGQPVERLPILPEAERRRILADFNPAPPAGWPARTLVEWFAEAAARWPEREAVVWPGGGAEGSRRATLTYSGLDRAARRLARRLRARGVGPDVFVGLFADRSPELVIGLLGILQAGGAYVPIDPAYPAERIALLVEDARTPVLVTQPHLRSRLGDVQAELVLLDPAEAIDATGAPAAEPELPPVAVRPDHVAYVIYTSGSTGRPKGALVTHGNVTRLFQATAGWFGFGPDDVWTLFHSVAFDFSVWEMWGALLHGGRLVVVPPEVTRSPDALLDLLAREEVSVLNQTPSAFRALVEAEGRAAPPPVLRLRDVVLGGEALDLQSLRPWFRRRGDERPRVVNMYGITETTVHVTYRRLREADLGRRASVIGVPIPDLRVHILDRCGQPVPIGIPGEIHVGGAGVARGYWNRPELTAERFLPDPAGSGRLYRSGDLARYRPDGDIEYLGRIDHQVKIRGFRIELGEIEAVLGTHPAVRQAVVLAPRDSAGPRLVAYVVTSAADPSLPAALRAHLHARLPEYMIPAAIVPLGALPLTSHGKVDRARLPDPDTVPRPGLDDARPRTEMERIVAEILGELLGLRRVGLGENFFDLGAQSLLLVRAHARLQERLGRTVPLLALYQYPTVTALAAFLAEGTEPAPVDRAVAEAQARAARRRAARQRRDSAGHGAGEAGRG